MKKMVTLLVLFLLASAMMVSAVPVNGWEYDSMNSRWICRSRTGCYTSSSADQQSFVLHDYFKGGARDSFNPSSVSNPPEHIIPQITPRAQALMQQMNIRIEGTNLVFPNGERVDFDPSGLSTRTLEFSITEENGNLKLLFKNDDFSEQQYTGTTALQIFQQIDDSSPASDSGTFDTPIPEISFQLPGSGESRRYILIEESGEIDGIQYAVSYYDSDHSRVIYIDSSGMPIGYSDDDGLNKVRYGQNIGAEGEALRQAILAQSITTLTISGDRTGTSSSTSLSSAPHVIRKADGTYETEKGYYFYVEGSVAPYLTTSPTTEGARVVSIREIAQRALGEELYKTYGESQIDWDKSDPVNYVLKTGGTIKVATTVTVGRDPVKSTIIQLKDKDQPDQDKSGTYVIRNGQQVAFQSLKQQEEGTITLSGNPFYVGKDNKDALNDLASGKVVKYYEGADAKNQLGVIAVQGNSRTITNFKEETQTIFNTQTSEKQVLDGDYYAKGESSCTDSNGCFRPSGGTLYDANENALFLLNYDYESIGSAGIGVSVGAVEVQGGTARITRVAGVEFPRRTEAELGGLERIEMFNPATGRFEGITQPDGTSILAQRNEKGEYTGGFISHSSDGRITTYKQQGEQWVYTYDNQVQAAEQRAVQASAVVAEQVKRVGEAGEVLASATTEDARRAARVEVDAADAALDAAHRAEADAERELGERRREAQDSARERAPALEETRVATQGSLAIAQTSIEAIYGITKEIKSYPALTRLFGLPRTDRDLFQFDADKTFAPMLGSNWFPSAICEAHYDIEPEGMAMIKTVSGTYQAVANIQMERSETTSPILCARNPDPEAEEEFICDPGQVCVDNNFCHKDEDGDQEQDEDTPLQGYFYKITWGVSAPRDEAFTPFINEDGVAVSFNVWIDTTPNDGIDAGATHMYIRNGDVNGPIELRNGQSDKDTIIHYSPNLFQEACIGWKQAPSTADSFSGSSTIGDVCFTVDVSSIGEANFGNAGRNAPASTVQGGQVTRNAGW